MARKHQPKLDAEDRHQRDPELERELFAEDPSLREPVEVDRRRMAAEDTATGP